MTIMEENFNVTTPLPEECQPLTEREVEIFHDVSWWFEGLLQCCVGSIGFLANVMIRFCLFPLETYLENCNADCQRTWMQTSKKSASLGKVPLFC